MPGEPGCYLMKDYNGQLLYVGKSKNLRNRLKSYLNHNNLSNRIKRLVAQINKIDVSSPGSDYDVINQPLVHIKDSVRSGATGYAAFTGELKEIRESIEIRKINKDAMWTPER